MKKAFTFMLCLGMLTSCALHNGYIQNSASLSSNNFTYVAKDITGTSKVTYVMLIGGMFGGLKKESLIGNAKKDLLSKNQLKNNQALANITVSWKQTFVLPFTITQKCILTADIVEFNK